MGLHSLGFRIDISERIPARNKWGIPVGIWISRYFLGHRICGAICKHTNAF